MDYTALSIAELEALLEEKRLEALAKIEGLTDETPAADRSEAITAAKDLQAERVKITEALNAKVEAENAADADLADLAEVLAATDPEDETGDGNDVDPDTPDVDPEVTDEQPAAPEAGEPVEAPAAEVVQPAAVPVAAASRTRRIARTSRAPQAPAAAERPRLSIVAAANVPDINQGSVLDGVRGIGTALVNRTSAFTPPQGDGKTENLQKFGIATIRMPKEDKRLRVEHEFNPSESQAALEFASDQRRLSSDKGSGSLVAAGGWCAPSETLYDLCEGESLDGIVDLPEVQISRGGINYTSGPQFADFYGGSGPGFLQTEAQAIAGVAKTCVTVTCPAFTEVRLDAIGLCIKTPILTEAGYPELTDRFTRGTLVAWAHQVNANVIARIEALSNANRTPTNGLGSAVTDSLEALELLANEKREKYRLPLADPLEAIIPFWVRDVYKSDLRRRTGQLAPVSDEQMDAYFTASKISVQWAYDWQTLASQAGAPIDAYPATYRVVMYKAGTFVKGTTDVINLSAVYDAASLAVNVYTGLFVEQGILVARMCWDSDRITLPICTAGRTGAADLTCA